RAATGALAATRVRDRPALCTLALRIRQIGGARRPSAPALGAARPLVSNLVRHATFDHTRIGGGEWAWRPAGSSSCSASSSESSLRRSTFWSGNFATAPQFVRTPCNGVSPSPPAGPTRRTYPLST